jgi:hypothetical protein
MKTRTIKLFCVGIVCVFASLSWVLLSVNVPHRYAVKESCFISAERCYLPPVSLSQILP